MAECGARLAWAAEDPYYGFVATCDRTSSEHKTHSGTLEQATGRSAAGAELVQSVTVAGPEREPQAEGEPPDDPDEDWTGVEPADVDLRVTWQDPE